MKKKDTLTNRNGQTVSVIIEQTDTPNGLCFILHGLGGYKEQLHIEAIAEAFLDADVTTVRIDATNGIGESDGDYENANCTEFLDDLEDVIKWAEGEEWYDEPFFLAGHSLGSMAVCYYAAKNPQIVMGIAPISTVVAGKFTIETTPKDALKAQEESGFWIRTSRSKPGVVLKLKWHQFKKDILKYDLLRIADKITMPVLLVVGENDEGTTPEHQSLLFEALPGKKDIHVISGAKHTFREQEHLEILKHVIKHWVKTIEQ